MTNTAYTIEAEGRLFDLECDTEDEAIEFAEGHFAERYGPHNDIEAFLVEMKWCEEHGGWVEVSREPRFIVYEEYRGDYEEHTTHWGL